MRLVSVLSQHRLYILTGTILATLAGGSGPAYAGAIASAFKKETRNRGTNYWNAQSAIDGNMETCWMVPGESENAGEYIELDVPKSSLDKVALTAGWQKNDDTFTDYARVKAAKIEVFAYDEMNELAPAGTATVSFEDKQGYQVVDIDDIQVGTDLFGGKVRITITDVYAGRDYPNFAVSEVLLHLTEFEAAAQVLEISSEKDGHTRDAMLDDDNRTYWLGDAEGALMQFGAEGFALSSVGILPGPTDYARPKTIEVSANGRTTTHELEDSKDIQWVLIPPVTGYTGSAFGEIDLKITDTYAGTKSTEIAIAELDVHATAYEGL